MLFRDRSEAGQRLARRLLDAVPDLPNQQPLVLALPRGGVPVGFEVAQALPAPLDVLVVRKLGAPEQEELGIGAVASGGTRVLDADTIRALAVSQGYLDDVTARELAELERRTKTYRDGRPPPPIAGRSVVLVDDGLATGVSARAALAAVQRDGPARLLLAVPVCPEETRAAFEREGYEVVCVAMPRPFHAVGVWYDDFHPTSDDEVVELLRRAWGEEGTLL